MLRKAGLEQVPGISETSINTWARYEFDVGANASAFVRAEYYYESETQVISNVPESVAAREVSMINASAGMRWDNGFEVMLWGRNLTDEVLHGGDTQLPDTISGVPTGGTFSPLTRGRVVGLELTFRQ